jgi:hypothetical protein
MGSKPYIYPMKSLFNSIDNAEIIVRINQLTPQSTGAWGKMNVSQMLQHCTMPLKVAYGDVKLKKTFIGFLFGRIARKKMAESGIPFKKNLPTDKYFIIKEALPDFDQSRNELLTLVKRFTVEGPDGITKDPHPFFGKLTSQQWDILQWKHLDHHLRQFGV